MVGVWSSHTIRAVVVEAVVVVEVMIRNVTSVVSQVILLESAACALVHEDLEVGDVEVLVLDIVEVPVMGEGLSLSFINFNQMGLIS